MSSAHADPHEQERPVRGHIFWAVHQGFRWSRPMHLITESLRCDETLPKV